MGPADDWIFSYCIISSCIGYYCGNYFLIFGIRENSYGELKAELEKYKRQGILENYGENGVVLSKSDKKVYPGDMVAIYSKDGYIIYCKIKTVLILKDKSQMVNMNYVDFVKI